MSGSDALEIPSEEAREHLGLAFGALTRFAELLAADGELLGLIGPRELPRLWSRHIVNSSAVVDFLPDSGTVADVGSGAGFPGVVVAAMAPDLEVHLVEPMERRVRWLFDVVAELDLDNVVVHRNRAEELHGTMQFDAVTSRAVASLDKLARWCGPLIRPGGRLVALKGVRAGEEIEDSRYVLRKLKLGPAELHEVWPPMAEIPARVVVAAKS